MRKITSEGGSEVYVAEVLAYNLRVRDPWTIGDVIRKARKKRAWDQQRLGEEALRFKITGHEQKINKATISKLEGPNPYTSEFGVVWRVLATLELSFADIEGRIESPFIQESAPAKTSTGRSRG